MPVASGRIHRPRSRSNRQRSLNVVLVDVHPSITTSCITVQHY